MNISVKSEYALRALFDLAAQQLAAQGQSGAPQPVKIAEIAKRQKIPQKFLELILAGLKQSGFVDSRRGADGGYLLARSPDSITIGEVLRSMENLKTPGRGQADDPFADIWGRVEAAVSEVLDQTTFSELARHWREKNTSYVPNWDI
ncbi:MAG: RrF2 family transcriptional regulator [Bryobacteraceae bacterium]